MTDLTGALQSAFDRWYSITGSAGIKDMMSGIERVTGSKKAAAEAAGIGRSTWGFWDAEKRAPSGVNLAKLQAAYERLTARPRRQAAAAATRAPRQADVSAVVVAYPAGDRYVNSKNNGYRTFRAGGGGHQQKGTLTLDGGPTGGAVGAWVRGDDAAPAFLEAIAAAYEPFGFEGGNVEVLFR